jgi:hypothetical protein
MNHLMQIAMKTFAKITMVVLMTFLSVGTLRSQDLGDFTFSYGYESNLKPRHEDEGLNNQKLKASLTIVLSPNVYFRVGNTNLVSKQRPDGTRVNGIGSTSIAFGADVVTEDGTGIKRQPSVSVEYLVVLPTASKSLNSFRGTDHSVAVAIAKSFGDSQIVNGSVKRRNKFEVDLGGFFAQKEAGGYLKTPEMTLAFSRALDSLANKKYVYGSELYMSAPTKDSLSEIYILNQLKIKLKPTATFKTGFRTGLTPNSPKVAFFGSISFDGSFK